MAILASSAGDYASHSWGTALDFVPVTFYMRFRRDGTAGTGADHMIRFTGPEGMSFSMRIDLSDKFGCYFQGNSAVAIDSPTITTGNWYEGIIRGNTTGAGTATGKMFLREVGTTAITAGTGTGPAIMYTWNSFQWPQNSSTDWFNGALEDLRIWNAALTDAECELEFGRRVPARTTNLVMWIPTLDRTSADFGKDYSGNGRNVSANGGLSYVDGAPVSWGAPVITFDEVSVTYSFARPTSDITTNWTPSTGTDHYALIDEATASDADYIYATAVSQTDEVKLGALTAPTGDVQIRYRVQGVAASGRVTVSMYQGATLVKADTQRTADGNYTMTVTSTDYAGVTDWSDIRLRFVSG
jgi:hypothetical protein